jgi:hypothetical protein
MKRKWRVKSQLARDLEDPQYRKRFEADYAAFKLEVQLLLALERKHWSYSDLARALGTQKSHISRDLKGRGLGSASLSRVAKIAEALGLRFVPLCISEKKIKQALPLILKLVAA